MIFSMKKKFEEKGYYWNRSKKGWMKSIICLDKTKKNGYSLIGDFVNAGTNKNNYEPGLYLNCNKGDGDVVYQLLKLTEDGDVELIQELINPGRAWAVEFWEKIDENLEGIDITPSYPDQFLNKTHLYGYLEHIKFGCMSIDEVEKMLKKIDDIDLSGFELCEPVKQYSKIIKWVCDTFMEDCQSNDISCEEIKKPNNLLNLNYLNLLKPNGVGFAFNARRSEKHLKKQKMILIYEKQGRIHIRWFNHLLS